MVLISPLFPPARGGLPDHTARLAHELAVLGPVRVVTSPGVQTLNADYQVQPKVADWRSPRALLEAVTACGPGPVIWQYVPHMYGRGGVNGAVPSVMAELRRRGCYQLVIAHEITAAYSLWPHRCWYAWAHRRQWDAILRHADSIGISTEAWLVAWTKRRPQRASKLWLAPSPASFRWVECAPTFAAEWRAEREWPAQVPMLACLGSLTESRQFAWVVGAWKQAYRPDRPVALVAVGGQPRVLIPLALRPWFKTLGFLPEADVAKLLSTCDLLLLPFEDGTSERRTTFMAGLCAGCAVVTTIGESTGPTLREAGFFRAVDAQAPQRFAAEVRALVDQAPARAALGHEGRQAYLKDYDWPRLLEQLACRLPQVK